MIMENKKFNIIGFDRSTYSYEQYRHCSVHPGVLLPVQGDTRILQCQQCGQQYPVQETVIEQNIQSNISPSNSQTKIIQAKKKKKFFDQEDNEINDKTLLNDMARGNVRVIKYHEEKSGKERHIVRN